MTHTLTYTCIDLLKLVCLEILFDLFLSSIFFFSMFFFNAVSQKWNTATLHIIALSKHVGDRPPYIFLKNQTDKHKTRTDYIGSSCLNWFLAWASIWPMKAVICSFQVMLTWAFSYNDNKMKCIAFCISQTADLTDMFMSRETSIWRWVVWLLPLWLTYLFASCRTEFSAAAL